MFSEKSGKSREVYPQNSGSDYGIDVSPDFRINLHIL